MNKRFPLGHKFRIAYENTLKDSASHSNTPTTFQCGDDSTNPNDYLDCDSCPFYSRNDCSHDHNFTEWQEIWYRITGEKDERTPEDVLNFVPLATMITPNKDEDGDEEVKQILDAQLDKVNDIVNPKFRMIYNLLGQPEEYRIESADLSLVLATINFWYKDVIKWNFIVKGPISDIPSDFKDLYFRVYDSVNMPIFVDEYTLASAGLAKQWARTDNTDKDKN